MNESKISVRYAKALFNLSVEQKLLEQVKADVLMLLNTCEIDEFNEFLNSPIISISKKQEVFSTLFKNSINKIVLDFLLLLAKGRREIYLKIISLDFLKYYRDFLGIKEAELTTALEISEETKNNISLMLNKIMNSKIEIKHKVNNDIIGGFILRVDDNQIDASVKTQLKNIKKELIKK